MERLPRTQWILTKGLRGLLINETAHGGRGGQLPPRDVVELAKQVSDMGHQRGPLPLPCLLGRLVRRWARLVVSSASCLLWLGRVTSAPSVFFIRRRQDSCRGGVESGLCDDWRLHMSATRRFLDCSGRLGDESGALGAAVYRLSKRHGCRSWPSRVWRDPPLHTVFKCWLLYVHEERPVRRSKRSLVDECVLYSS
jgi:hypothetical protein